MKKSFILFVLFISLIINAFSQSGSDYYLPLCVGNFASFYTPESNVYGGRKTNYFIKQEDLVNNQVAFLQEAYEILDNSPNDTNVFQQFWLRKDSLGNVLLVAINMNCTGLIADALILPVPHMFIPNEYLSLGYSRSYPFGDQTTYDTVVSVSSSVGVYNNCIVVRETLMSNQMVDLVDQYSYAPSAGIVKMERLYKRFEVQTFVASLTNILNYNCYLGLQNCELIDLNSVKLYPNPAFDIINLEINNTNVEIFTLNIYNIMGLLVRNQIISKNDKNIYVGNFNNGIYIIELKSNDLVINHKLIIQR